MNTINEELKSNSNAGLLSQVTTIGTTLTTMANSFKLAGTKLKALAPGADLRQAFQRASACKQYVH
jgi:hypothetical protein